MATIGVVLAGGFSSRMGKDKALLCIENISMLDHVVCELNQTSVRKTVVCRNDNNNAHLPDLIPHKGPLSGVHSAAMQYPSENLLIVPVDLPLIDHLTLEALVKHGRRHQRNVRYAKQSLPLYINNTAALRKSLDHTLRCTNRFSVDRFCSHFPLTELEIKQPLTLFNTNTPEQWKQAKEHLLMNIPLNHQEECHESFKPCSFK
jgi:molybdopterin-guanine dinucleotide biosynthesis protein A